MKSLENEPRKIQAPPDYRPNPAGWKTDTARMAALHQDILNRPDSFKNENQYSKALCLKRPQPIVIDYTVTFVTKYKEDLDQIASNFAVHFRPDIYFKWYHPRFKVSPLEAQVLWRPPASIWNPMPTTTRHKYMSINGTATFSVKSWLFFGLRRRL